MMQSIREIATAMKLETEISHAQTGPDWDNRHPVILGPTNSPRFNVDAWNAEMVEIDRRNGTRIRRKEEKRLRKLEKQGEA